MVPLRSGGGGGLTSPLATSINVSTQQYVPSVSLDLFVEHFRCCQEKVGFSRCAPAVHLTEFEVRCVTQCFVNFGGTIRRDLEGKLTKLLHEIKIAENTDCAVEGIISSVLGPLRTNRDDEPVRLAEVLRMCALAKEYAATGASSDTFQLDDPTTPSTAEWEKGFSSSTFEKSSSPDGLKWESLAEDIFGWLAEDATASLVSTRRATAFFVAMLPRQQTEAERHAEIVRQTSNQVMLLDEFVSGIMIPLRRMLRQEPRPFAGGSHSSKGRRSVSSRNASVVVVKSLSVLCDTVDTKGDSCTITGAIQSLAHRSRQASHIQACVLSDPREYFRIPPCSLRVKNLLYLLHLNVMRLRCFTLSFRKRSTKSWKPTELALTLCRGIERAVECITRHLECERCAWVAKAQKSPRRISEGKGITTARPPSAPPSESAATLMSRHLGGKAILPIPVDEPLRLPPFTPRTNTRQWTPSPRFKGKLEVSNESNFVKNIFLRALHEERLFPQPQKPSKGKR